MPVAHNGDVEIHYERFGDSERPTLLLVNGLGVPVHQLRHRLVRDVL